MFGSDCSRSLPLPPFCSSCVARCYANDATSSPSLTPCSITDGNSVPIESKLFPDLSKNGSYNPVTMVYTQEQVKAVVDYARHRGIRVVPEFDMPVRSRTRQLASLLFSSHIL